MYLNVLTAHGPRTRLVTGTYFVILFYLSPIILTNLKRKSSDNCFALDLQV